jgi:hypothetical protein
MSKSTIRTLKAIPNAVANGIVEAPPLENEPPHKRLARLTAGQERLVKEIQEHKLAWAQRNMAAQQKRQTIASNELTAFRDHHGSLASALAEVNLQIGQVNKEIREHKAAVQAGRTKPEPVAPVVRTNGINQRAPLKHHVEFPSYFLLACEQELDKRMFDKVVGVAKSMLANAVEMGIEELRVATDEMGTRN